MPYVLPDKGPLGGFEKIKLYRARGLNPVVDEREELPLLPFGYPIGFVPAASRGVTQ